MERCPNEEQLRVIKDLENNLILFASAGTGKTFTVANRVGRVICENYALPKEILCLTFTAKACEEMREDIVRYAGEQANAVEIRTIHGFCYQLMREENRRRNDKYSEATVCDEVDAEELLQSILSSQYYLWEGEAALTDREEELPDKQFEIFTKKSALRNLVSAVKHVREEQELYTNHEAADHQNAFAFLRRTREEEYENLLSFSQKGGGQGRDEEFERAMEKHVGKLISAYDDHLRQSNRVDYDDLIIFAGRYLKNEETRARWSTRYKYIVVDEMQDTSVLEYSVLKQIFGKNNVMMCGDFFQSIYEWRGSKPEYVLGDFIKEFSAKVYMFSENYRSTRMLARATFGYLKNTYPEWVGKYCPEEIRVNSGEEGEKILCLGFDSRREEAYQIYRYVRKNPPQKPFGLCVMARSNGYIASLLRAFEEFNLEYLYEDRLQFFTAEENYQFYRKPVIKDVLAVMKLLLNKTDRLSMERITEKYVRLVGAKTIEVLRGYNSLGASIVSFIDPQLYSHEDPYHVLIEAFHGDNIVVYDTETTGLDLTKDQMVQLSAIRIDAEGNILDKFDQMIVPTVPIEKGAYETHGFDLDYIRLHGGVTAKEALEKFSAFCNGAVLVGHNSFRFDAPLIKRQLRENGLPALNVLCEYDTLVMAKQFHGALPDFRLSTLCFKYDIVNEAAHNAYGDIVATGKVLTRMIKEDVIPTALPRRNVLARHKEKFQKLYAFLSELSEKIERNDIIDLIPCIIDRMMIRKKYAAEADQRAMKELEKEFSVGCAESADAFLRNFVERAELLGSRADLLLARKDQIPILTVHQAKGCEFDVVILAGADDRNFPTFFSRGTIHEEEEKKVFYVAISRAKKKLILTKAAYNGRNAIKPSPYAKKIPAEVLSENERWQS